MNLDLNKYFPNNSILLEDLRTPEKKPLFFTEPNDILILDKLEDSYSFFQKIEEALAKGFYAAGYFTYELGNYFEDVPSKKLDHYAWIGIYSSPLTIDVKFQDISLDDFLANYEEQGLSISKDQYLQKIAEIKRHLYEGNVYQINYTDQLNFQFKESPFTLYSWLREQQRVSYASIIKNEFDNIISFSPELFFEKQKNTIISKPMKGTIKKGKTYSEMLENIHFLRNDEKAKSENIMIVDLLRNDIGKITKHGSVKVEQLLEVENYKSVVQLTSTIKGELKKNICYYDIFKSLFPCGSITGAPKKRALEIISSIEPEPRGVYTGAIGYFSPKDSCRFSVPIRTISLQDNQGELGVGGGIIWESKAEDEYEECLLKTHFLTQAKKPFHLIESIRVEKKTCLRFNEHLTRLYESSRFFDFHYDIIDLQRQVDLYLQTLNIDKVYKLRLELNFLGKLKIESLEIERTSSKNIICFAKKRVHSDDTFLYHKTTNRSVYNQYFKLIQNTQYADVIFMNEKEEITEGAISNIFVELDGTIYTPPINSGLLNGIFRKTLLKENPIFQEKVLRKEDLFNSDKIFLTNSVRGKTLVKVENVTIA